jgi:histidinol-phosphate aminotransferase
VLIDEAYHPFHSESVASWVDECPNLIVARTFAKAWGMAGLRIGYAIANPEVVPYLHKVRPMYEVSTLAVAVTERMLDHEDEMIGAVARLNDGRDWFVSEMRSRGFQALQSHGNFCHVRFGDDGGRVHAALRDHVLYRADGGGCLAGYSRFSATTRDAFAPIVERIAGAISR